MPKQRRAKKEPKLTYRVRENFWCDIHKDDELLTLDLIAYLKSIRKFGPTVRLGIRILCELYDGKVDLLLEKFPWIENTIMERSGRSSRELEQFEQMIQRQMAQLVTVNQSGNMGQTGPSSMHIDADLSVEDDDTSAVDNFLDFSF